MGAAIAPGPAPPRTTPRLTPPLQTALRVLPTLGSCALMMLTTRHCKHPLALPATLALIVAAFHLVLLAAGVSLEQAQAAGWVLKAAVGAWWLGPGLLGPPGGRAGGCSVRATWPLLPAM